MADPEDRSAVEARGRSTRICDRHRREIETSIPHVERERQFGEELAELFDVNTKLTY